MALEWWSCLLIKVQIKKNTVCRTQEKLKLQSISETFMDPNQNCCRPLQQQNSGINFILLSPPAPMWAEGNFTFAVYIRHRNMSCSYSAALRQCKTSRSCPSTTSWNAQYLFQYSYVEIVSLSLLTGDVSHQCCSVEPYSLDPQWSWLAYQPPEEDWSATSRFHNMNTWPV